MKPQIDSGIPIPSLRKTEGITALFRDLKIGDSFIVPDDWQRTSLYVIAHRLNIKITVRKGRCWRTA